MAFDLCDPDDYVARRLVQAGALEALRTILYAVSEGFRDEAIDEAYLNLAWRYDDGV